MRTDQIYDQYMIPKNLREHMLRVASFAQILTQNWKGGEIDKKAIVQACVFHDIAKPISFDLTKQAQFGMTETDIKKLGEVQIRIKTNYGSDEHQATVAICKEIGLSPKAVKLVNNLEWKYIPDLLENNDVESLIPIYCDIRIGPMGILTLEQRYEELGRRMIIDDFSEMIKNSKNLEKLIQDNVVIDLSSVTDEQINMGFNYLLNIEL